MMKYLKARKKNKRLIQLKEELAFYAPLYQLAASYVCWFLPAVYDQETNAVRIEGKDIIVEERIAKIYTELTEFSDELRRMLTNYTGRMDISFFTGYSELISNILAKNETCEVIQLMYSCSEIFEGSKRYLRLKEEIELLDGK